MSATWKGTSATISNPSKRVEKYLIGGIIEVTLTIQGRWSTLKTLRPTIGTVLDSDLDGYENILVTDVTISREGKGELAEMTIQATNAVDPLDFDGGGNSQEVREVEYARVDQDIRYHPVYRTTPNVSTFQPGPLTQAQREAVDEYMSDTNKTTKAEKYAAFSEAQKHLADRLMRGQTAYAVYIPVARRTTIGGNPILQGVGKQEQPPALVGAPTASANGKLYTYVKTADRKSKQGGRWTRVEEWTGFEQVDTTILETI